MSESTPFPPPTKITDPLIFSVEHTEYIDNHLEFRGQFRKWKIKEMVGCHQNKFKCNHLTKINK